MTNPSTRQARALVDGLLRSGIDEVVVAPGSRNGPLSIALAQAAVAGLVRLHVRLDERSASFLALGIAKRTGTPVAVLCTSGTAAAHLHAAAYEATEAGVPLLLLTADRPASLRGKGANQTIDQHDMFGTSVLRALEAPLATDQPDAFWRALVADAAAAACGSATCPPGAVHVNLPFAEPLVPGDGDTTWLEALPDKPARRAAVEVPRGAWSRIWPAGGATPRGVIITSDRSAAADVLAFAEALQWPVLAEPGSGARAGATAIARYPDVIGDPELRPEVVVTIGRFALSRSVVAFVRSAGRHVSVGRATSDPFDTVDAQIVRLPDVSRLSACGPEWMAAWRESDARAEAMPAAGAGAFVAAALAAVERGDLVWYGPSSTIRHAERVAPAFDADVVSLVNRGTNGIDGVVSSAIGSALAHQRADGGFALALMGDLTFLHDINGLLVEEHSPVPDIAFVVLDSNGGRIFAELEQGAAEYAAVFDRVYGTPHNRDVAAIARAYGVAAETVSDTNALGRAISEARARGGMAVIVINDRG
jgi:2-succinyl-5-enolpyruvyl-6-hydroxy-3-cyclohexene-1-carboxylate synthase